MFDEKNVYIRQAEIKGSFKQNNSGIFLIGELTVNSSLKNYKKVLHDAFDLTLAEIKDRNSEYDGLKKEKTPPKIPPKKEKKPEVKGLD